MKLMFEKDTKSKIKKELKHLVKKKNILLVDDILDSGRTVEAVISYMKLKKPTSVKTVTLLCRKSNKRKPTFFAEECEDGEWIVFPWEQNETPD